jgi:hypothetical protein
VGAAAAMTSAWAVGVAPPCRREGNGKWSGGLGLRTWRGNRAGAGHAAETVMGPTARFVHFRFAFFLFRTALDLVYFYDTR